MTWSAVSEQMEFWEQTGQARRGVNDGAGAANDSQVCVPAPSFLNKNVARSTLVQLTEDWPLARSRECLLRKAGFEVYTALSGCVPQDVLAGDFAIVLFCQTVKRERAELLAAMFRKTPNSSRRSG